MSCVEPSRTNSRGLERTGASRPVEEAYGLATARPECVGMAADRLARIAPVMQKYIDGEIVPGLLTVIARHGRVVHCSAQGHADVASGAPMRPDTIFRLFSMTKPVTGVAVLMAYEDGCFLVDDAAADYLPEFARMKVWTEAGLADAARPITIRHLLTHTAGFSYREEIYKPLEHEVARRRAGVSLAEHVRQLASRPLAAQPGTQWEYADAMAVLARLVEVVSGQRFGDFVRQRILAPLGMIDTDFHVPSHKAKRLARLYEQAPSRGFVGTDGYGGDYTKPPTIEGGSTGLVGTASDYVRFAQMLLNGGELDGVRVLSPTSIKLMMSNHLGPEFGETPLASLDSPTLRRKGFGFGFCGLVVTDAIAAGTAGSAGEYSWGGWANTDFWIDPEEDLIGLVFTQVIPTGRPLTTRARMHQMTYQAIVGD